ncbi:MAG TPA: Do family serine endopeptidase [Salinivirgaceae bacterium]|nr:Do family serine endopeptidase [Salinivirgaceae bacterium]
MKTKWFIINFLSGILGGVVVISLYFSHADTKAERNSSEIVQTSSAPVRVTVSKEILQPTYIDLTEAARRTVDAVVHVKTLNNRQPMGSGNPFFDFFFGDPRGSQPQPILSAGSGVIISRDGYIVTNNHVIENADKIEITLNDKRTYEARIIGADPGTDIALLKIDESDLPFLTFGDSDSTKVGEWVLAVGNPFNLTSTVTAGIISAKARNINIINRRYAIESFIQTDAAVNPGNSGGALVNAKGELIGINTAIASQTGTFTGYSFAVPISIVRKVVSDLMEFGEVQRAFLGVIISDINSQLASKYSLKVLDGVLIQDIELGSAAEKAGIEPGDVIVQVGSVPIKSVAEFQDHLIRFRPGDEVVFTINRKGKIMEKRTVLQNRIGSTATIRRTDVVSLLGAYFKPVDANVAQTLGIRSGLQVVELESGKLMSAGIRKGYIITFVNGERISDVESLSNALKKSRNGGVYVEGIYPNGMRAYYAFAL